ncbi:unnamed protein product [Urochloa humidicola]
MASFLSLLCYFLTFLCLNTAILVAADANESEIDRQSLLCFKSGIYFDPTGILSAWRNTSLNFCTWPGVSCSTRLPARVASLNLTSVLHGGQIYGCIANLTSLSQIILTDNGLSGAIPEELGMLPGLRTLMLADNHLQGVIPPFGRLPEQLAGCNDLLSLSMEGNKLQGEIPASFDTLMSIQYINLSRNDLSGNVPEFFENFTMLNELDLSYNNFEGPIPTRGIFAMSTMVHLGGNKRLCSNFSKLALPPCHGISDTRTKNHKNHHVPAVQLLVPIYTVAFLLLLFCMFLVWRKIVVHIVVLHSNIWYLLKLVTQWSMRQVCSFSWNVLHFVTHWRREVRTFPEHGTVRNVWCFLTLRRREVEIFPTYHEKLKKASYNDILKATDWFSPSRRISSTRTGSVYVGRFEFDTDFVAIKVFNLNERGARESYLSECEVLRSIRHRNILKSVTSCSSLDTENNEFNALVFQFMTNGSVESWLHPKHRTGDKPKRTLSLGQRICIVTDVASALDYLHSQLKPPLVHCDLKPGNVLLDYDMTARVGDFGSAKFLSQDSGGFKRLVSIQGTIGYLAPEYGMGCGITTRGDVYSFGVLLLEMLTGKRPTDEMFVDGLNLHNVVNSLFPNRIAEILDPHMTHEEHQLCAEVLMQSYIIPLVAVGLSCSMESPKDRPGMQDVCAKLCAIKEAFL